MRKILIGIGVLLVIGIGVLLIAPLPGTGEAQSITNNVRTALIERTTLYDTVEGSGTIAAEQVYQLTFGVSGTVEEVLVEVGDEVTAGQVLARLDTTDLERELELAELALETQRISYEEQTAPPTAQEIAQAQAQLASARSQLETAQNNAASTEDELTNSCSGVESARQTLDEAQAAYDDYLAAGYQADPVFVPDPNSNEAKALQSAQAAYERAVAQCNIAMRGTDSTSQLESAQASYEQALAAYENLINGPDENDIIAAEAALRQAEIKVEQARQNLENATLVAPFDGIITDVGLVVGQTAGASAAVTIADTSRLHVDVSVDELDIVQVSVGQEANITVEAFDDVVLPGTVRSISPVGTQSQGLVTYTVRVDLNQATAASTGGAVAQQGQPAAQEATAGGTGQAGGFVPGGAAGASGPGGLAALREVIPIVMQLGTVDELNTMLEGENGEETFYAALAEAGVSQDTIDQIRDAGGPAIILTMLERFSQAQAPGGFTPGGQTASGTSGSAGSPQAAGAGQVAPSTQGQGSVASASPPIRLGMTADVEIVVNRLENVLVVPTSAIQRQGQQEYVLVDDGAGGQVQVPVTTGETVSGMTVIEGDISEGQTVYYTVSSSTGTNNRGGFVPGGPGGLGILGGGPR